MPKMKTPSSSEQLQSDFSIKIEFDAKKESPSNALRVLTEIIEEFEALDADLITSIDAGIKPVILLEDIKVGSVKVWLKNFIESISDDGLKEVDVKKIVGPYLVKAKYAIIKFLEGKTQITSRDEVQALESELYRLAKETDVKKLPAYAPIQTAKLVQHLSKITTTVKTLREGDKAVFEVNQEKVDFNMEINLAPESIIDILTKQTLQSSGLMLLKVKKPDYLGDSKWEVRHERKHIVAKIDDTEWLKQFQQRQLDVRPGDSLKADVITTVKYDHNNEVIGTEYTVTKVHQIIKPEGNSQISMMEDVDEKD